MHYRRQICFLLAALLLIPAAWLPQAARQTSGAAEQITQGVTLPILMYHQISEKPQKWGKYVVSPRELEADLRLIRARGFTPITVSELRAAFRGEAELPEKPVMITFDDGNRSDYVYAFPLAKKYGMKMISSPVASYSEQYSALDDRNVDYAHLTWAEMREMQASGLFEFQNHSYDLHRFDVNRKGCLKRRGETEASYRSLLLADFEKSQALFVENGLPAPICFTYPFGSTNALLLQYVKERGFSATLGTYEHVNHLTGDSLFDLGRFNRPHGYDIRRILNQAE